ncbi:MAG: Uncharacterized protein FD161_587 [Limisphaerales bacterium]|nr:MAG: Uncharacterized protein FD161_587 [Limisphaerales bacterium]KAG0510192.1 MAG: Uncharacterized protein E1N63_587 [Limisphaerales bacterium]TXT51925.1 MAG: Uncharacterized protein FD140_1313 [Limisphaerales bacterium]
MSAEPQRDIEKDLLAYKQRRDGQLGAPVELHPATRRMLQGEAARVTSRPLLTSEEAAKNFVRSFVMSHQQPGFFARHKQRILWGGGMFACLAVVLAVLRNDPQRSAREHTFADKLPAPAPVSEPQATKPQPAVAANKLGVKAESLTRDQKAAQPAERGQEVAKHSGPPAGGFAPANPRGATVASGPMPAAQREVADRRSGSGAAPLPVPSGPANASATATRRTVAQPESALRRMTIPDADKKLAEKAEAGGSAQPAKSSFKAAQDTLAFSAPEAKKAGEEVKLKLRDALKRAPQATTAGVAGAAPAATPMPAAAVPLTRQLSYTTGGGGEAQMRQRFQQLDQRAGYRQNLNSPPVPQVMQDFAFERTGDRVRIVDADGSTYEGSVMPAPEAEARGKLARALDESKVRKDLADQQAQSAGATASGAQIAYRFYAAGLNRKLNQSVEFRGEWLPAAPAQSSAETPALQAASLGAVRLEAQSAGKQEKSALTNALVGSPAPAQAYLLLQQQTEPSPGRISGRAVVGGKSEFDIKAVTK